MDKHFKWTLIAVVTGAFFILFMPFLIEILTAAVFAFALDPLSRRLARMEIFKKYSIYFRRKQWVAITLLLLVLAIILPITFAVYNIYDSVHSAASAGFQNTDFYKDLVQLRGVIAGWANQLVEALNIKRGIDIESLGENFVNELGQDVMTLSAKFISHLPQFFLSIFVFACALYFFMAEQKKLRLFAIKTKLVGEVEISRLTNIFQSSCISTLFVSVIVGFIQAGTVAFGSILFHVGDFAVVFVVTFFLSFIPVIGAAPVALFLALLSLIKQDFGISAGFLVIAVIAGSIDNILRARLVGGEEDLHPVVVLLAIIGSIMVLGLPGLFLGPVIASATAKIYKAYVFEDPARAKDF
jgi:predicted PurR-regulated permease PerM